MRRIFQGLACVALLATAPASAAIAPPSASYDDMVARLKAGATDVDFAALRRAAVAQPHYNGYDQLDMAAARAAFDKHDWQGVEAVCDAQLAHDYLDINAHLLDALAEDHLGQADAAALHRRIWRGIVDAIIASGDGKSAQTAFHVIGVDEEYFLLQVMRLKPGVQALSNQGGVFDVLDATDESGATHQFWFDISSFFGKFPLGAQ